MSKSPAPKISSPLSAPTPVSEPAAAPAPKPMSPGLAAASLSVSVGTPSATPLETRKKIRRGWFARMNEHLSLQEKINFARHLSIVIKAGLPVYEGLRIIRNQNASTTMNRILDTLIADVNNGRFLSDSLDKFDYIFGDFFINIIRVGEASGTLSQNLLYLAEELQKSRQLESQVRSAMIYPIVILVATIGVTGFLAFFILPKLIPVLTGLNVELPFSTRFLIGSIAFFQKYGLYVIGGIITFFYTMKFILKKSISFRYLFHRFLLIIPIISPLIVSINMVTFSRVLAMLLKSGVKIVEALSITSNTFSNMVFKRILNEANEEIKRGGQLATILGKHKHFFPVLLSGMIQVGENTGNLEDNLFYLSEYYTEEVDSKLHNLTSLLEPVMLLFMSLVVGFVAISIITPIYSMSQGVH